MGWKITEKDGDPFLFGHATCLTPHLLACSEREVGFNLRLGCISPLGSHFLTYTRKTTPRLPVHPGDMKKLR